MASGEDDRDPRPHRANPDLQRAFALNQRLLANFDTPNIRDGVEAAGHAFERNAEIARTRTDLCRDQRQDEERGNIPHSVGFTRPESIIGNSRGMSVSGASSSSRAHLWPV